MIDPGDASLAGYSFNGSYYFDKVLPFGLCSAAFLCQKITSAIRYICQILRILIVNYFDDLAGADTEALALKSYQELKNAITFCGLEESVEKTCPPSTQMVFIGILFDSETLTLSVTPERLHEIKMLVQEWLQYENAINNFSR